MLFGLAPYVPPPPEPSEPTEEDTAVCDSKTQKKLGSGLTILVFGGIFAGLYFGGVL